MRDDSVVGDAIRAVAATVLATSFDAGVRTSR